MSDKIQIRGGSTAARLNFTLDPRTPYWDKDLEQLFIHDGVTVGGVPAEASPVRIGDAPGSLVLMPGSGGTANTAPFIVANRNNNASVLSGAGTDAWTRNGAFMGGQTGTHFAIFCVFGASGVSSSIANTMVLNQIGGAYTGQPFVLPNDTIFSFAISATVYDSSETASLGDVLANFRRRCVVKNIAGVHSVSVAPTVEGVDFGMVDYTFSVAGAEGANAWVGGIALQLGFPEGLSLRVSGTVEGTLSHISSGIF